jgi:hypothetical protein
MVGLSHAVKAADTRTAEKMMEYFMKNPLVEWTKRVTRKSFGSLGLQLRSYASWACKSVRWST